MRQATTYRRLARAALNTANVADDSTAAMLRLMAADYAAEADRLEAIDGANAPMDEPIEVFAAQSATRAPKPN